MTEDNIGSARIIKMLNVKDDRLVVDAKGIYSIENYLTTRRLMYWQVYLHKTAVGYEKMLINTLTRARDLVRQGYQLFSSPALAYFLEHDDAFNEDTLKIYADLDDSDIWSALKAWKYTDDKILATLATDMTDRHLFKVEVCEERPSDDYINQIAQTIVQRMNIAYEDTHYMMSLTEIGKDMYNPEDDSIGILYKNGTIKDVADASEILNVQLLSKKIRKYYLCYQRF